MIANASRRTTNPLLVASLIADSVSWTSTKFIWVQLPSTSGSFTVTPRYGHLMQELKPGRLFVHGGSGEWPNLFMDKEAEYDINMNLWVAISPDLGASSKVRNHASTVLNNTKLVYFGGEDENGVIHSSAWSTNFSSVGCDDGFATIFCTANTRVVCQPCARGTYALAGEYTCTACDAGKFAPANESSTCELCGRGKYGDGSTGAWKSSHCVECAAGKSSNAFGGECRRSEATTALFPPAHLETLVLYLTPLLFAASTESTCATCGGGEYSLQGW